MYNIEIIYMGLEDFTNDTTTKELIQHFYKVNAYEVIGIIAKWVLIFEVKEIRVTTNKDISEE